MSCCKINCNCNHALTDSVKLETLMSQRAFCLEMALSQAISLLLSLKKLLNLLERTYLQR